MFKITYEMENLFGETPVKLNVQYNLNLNKIIWDLNRVRKPNLGLVYGVIDMIEVDLKNINLILFYMDPIILLIYLTSEYLIFLSMGEYWRR